MRSTLGCFGKMGDYGYIFGGSKTNRKVCVSTGQSETYALEWCCKELETLVPFLRELGGKCDKPVVSVDNSGVVMQAQSQVAKPSATHYRCVQAFIRQLHEDQFIQVRDIDSEDNPADFFTKPLEQAAFEKHRLAIMGPQQPPRKGQDQVQDQDQDQDQV
jgi:hypothetical protein